MENQNSKLANSNLNKQTKNRKTLNTRKLITFNQTNGHGEAVKATSSKQSPTSSTADKFSSRNSLRSSRSFTDTTNNSNETNNRVQQVDLFTKPLMTSNSIDIFREFVLEKGIDSSEYYELLKSESFLKIEQNELICMLCGCRERYHSEYTIEKHLNSDRHNIQFCELRYELLQLIPNKKSFQINVLSELLNQWYYKHSLTDLEIAQREYIISDFDSIVKIVDPQCQCRLVGSLLTGTSLKGSNINLELLHPNSRLFESDPRAKLSIHHKLIDPDAEYGQQINFHTLHYDMIPNAVNTLYRIMILINSGYQQMPFEVISNLTGLSKKVPKLILLHRLTKLIVEVNCYADSMHKLSYLLRTYMSLDERAYLLAIIVKQWAKICKIDNPEEGSLPPETFLILIIYYLQRTSPPILPCLHQIIASKSKTDNPSHNEANNLSLGDLTLNDKQEELAKVNNDENDDVGSVEENHNEEEETDESYIDLEDKNLKDLNWESKNNSTVHELFLGFLKEMMNEFKDLRYAISIRTLDKVKPSNKNWGNSVKAIENPVKPKNNISRSIATVRGFLYIRTCFKESFYYLTSIPIDIHGKLKREKQGDPADYIELYVHKQKQDNYFLMRKELIKQETKYDPIFEMIQQDLFARDVEVINYLFNRSDILQLGPRIANCFHENLMRAPDIASMRFCWFCKKFNHIRIDCPDAKLLDLHREFNCYDINLDIKSDFDTTLRILYEKHQISEELSMLHNQIVEQLQAIIREGTGIKCCLQLFGSTVNDLGSKESDLDICLTIENNETGKGVDCVEVLEKVNKTLLKNKQVKEMEAILSARVPILKFKYKGIDIDISMYNLCGLYNSRLLKKYAQFDPRVPELFYLVKRYAKVCNIADASKGSLSSYAWSLLVVHYLQQTSPPILPVLQESSDINGPKPIFGVSGWNVWFDDDGKSRIMLNNELSVTQLLKGFFLYYGTFDFSLNVVSIRKSALFNKFQKNWHHCMMAIEDPFELTYNLASRLDDAMATYIINSFTQAFKNLVRLQQKYQRFAQTELPHIELAQEIFNVQHITKSSPPYRGCRICNRIGHKIKDCPMKNKKNNRPKINRRDMLP